MLPRIITCRRPEGEQPKLTDAEAVTPTQVAVDELAGRLWVWRRDQAPRSRDDIMRMDRANGWRPAWTAGDVDRYRTELIAWEQAVADLGVVRADGPAWTDARLLASACARVRWELDVVASWERDPWFYLDQTVGTVFDLLVLPTPFTVARSRRWRACSFPSRGLWWRVGTTFRAAPFGRWPCWPSRRRLTHPIN